VSILTKSHYVNEIVWCICGKSQRKLPRFKVIMAMRPTLFHSEQGS
jgi:hypothetical protein